MFVRRWLSLAACGVALGLGASARAQVRVERVYSGYLTQGESETPVVTAFYTTPEGRLEGRYFYGYAEDGTQDEGFLTGFSKVGRDGGKFTWRDSAGEGTLRVKFSADGSRFEGQWGFAGDRLKHGWDGVLLPPEEAPLVGYGAPADDGEGTLTGSTGGDLLLGAAAAYFGWLADRHANEQAAYEERLSRGFEPGARVGIGTRLYGTWWRGTIIDAHPSTPGCWRVRIDEPGTSNYVDEAYIFEDEMGID